jgi:glycine/D-amino acid oxidase-like deaminating enzyme
LKSVIVIGAGVVGASISYNLSRAGASVVVVERGEPGSGTSSASFAWVNANQKVPRDYFDLNLAGMKAHDDLDRELGGAPWLHRTGNLVWSGDPELYDEICRRMERLQSWGYNAQWLTASEVNQNLEPNLAFSGPSMRVAWFPDECWLDGPEFVRSVLDRAVKNGASVRSGQEVLGIDAGSDGVRVSLSSGQTLSADSVVNAAGPSADRIAAMVGRTLPLTPTRGLLVRVAVNAQLLSRVIHSTEVNIRPDGDGYLLLHHDSIDPLIGDSSEVSLDDPNCRELCKRARRVLPDINASKISETRVGVRPFPADRVSSIGAASAPGYYEAVTHSGVTLAALLGRLLSEEIMTGAIDPITEPFRADRF